MTSTRDFGRRVERFCESAHKQEYGLVTPKVDELCSALRTCGSDSGEERRERWERRLGEVEGAYRACDEAHGVQSLCNPFFEKAESLIRQCRS